jgi:DnaK suppressor protein
LQERNGGPIRKIEEALERIEAGTYDICGECEEQISEKRLKARPVNTLCIECKRKEEGFEKVIK